MFINHEFSHKHWLDAFDVSDRDPGTCDGLGCQPDGIKRRLTQTSKCPHVLVHQRGPACLTETGLKEGRETSPECGVTFEWIGSLDERDRGEGSMCTPADFLSGWLCLPALLPLPSAKYIRVQLLWPHNRNSLLTKLRKLPGLQCWPGWLRHTVSWLEQAFLQDAVTHCWVMRPLLCRQPQ